MVASAASALAISTSCWLATESAPTTASQSMATFMTASTRRASSRIRFQSIWRPRRSGSRPRKMFSATVSVGTSENSWNTVAMPARRAAVGSGSATGTPPRRMRPPSGWCAPDSVLISVDLPQPFSPSRPWICPPKS